MTEELSPASIQAVGLGLKGVTFRDATIDDYESVCSWVNARRELQLVGSEEGSLLTPEILDRWVKSAEKAVIFELGGEGVGFGTGSTAEWPLPPGVAEICHVIVTPSARRRYHGSTFLRIMTRELLHGGYPYRTVVVRVVPTNLPSLAVMPYLRWEEITNRLPWTTNTPFSWFRAPEGEQLERP